MQGEEEEIGSDQFAPKVGAFSREDTSRMLRLIKSTTLILFILLLIPQVHWYGTVANEKCPAERGKVKEGGWGGGELYLDHTGGEN